ncbi:MAG: TIR domain-containing protein [Acidimicrobiia bacterium]
MALINCPECGNQVSDRAPACPHCGFPIADSQRPADGTSQVSDAKTTPPTVSAPEPAERDPVPSESAAAADEIPTSVKETPLEEAPAPAQPSRSRQPKASAKPQRARQPAASGHVFVSYKSEDRERASLMAEALERRGWPVWWDHEIQAGQAFRRVIAEALDAAVCVVVLWTELSVESEWVQEEAQEAKARSVLIPALLDDVRQPLGFGQTQTANIIGWGGDSSDPMLDDLLRGVATFFGLVEVPPLLDHAQWEAIAASASAARSKAAAARATEERAAADAATDAAKQAAAEREAAALAGEREAEAEAAKREAEATAAAERATQAAEEREAAMAAELAEEHAEEVRAAAIRVAQVAEEAGAKAGAKAAEAVVARRDWIRFPREGVATLLGGILVAISASLPWMGDLTARDYSLDYLVDYEVGPGGSSMGVLLLVLAIAGGLLALVRIPRWITVIFGVVVIAVAMVFLVEVLRELLNEDDDASEFFQVVGLGPVVALIGGSLMLSGR